MAFVKSTQDKIIHAILSSQLALNNNEDLKNSFPAVYSKALKFRTNNYIEELLKREKDFDLLFDKEEISLVQVYDVLEKFTKVIASIPIWEMENFTEVVKAYFKDREAIEELTNKINKNHENNI